MSCPGNSVRLHWSQPGRLKMISPCTILLFPAFSIKLYNERGSKNSWFLDCNSLFLENHQVTRHLLIIFDFACARLLINMLISQQFIGLFDMFIAILSWHIFHCRRHFQPAPLLFGIFGYMLPSAFMMQWFPYFVVVGI